MDLREISSGHGRRHPWEIARAAFFRDRLAECGALRPGARVLDVGAGDGYVGSILAPALAPGGSVLCFDKMYTDEHLRDLGAAAPAGVSFARESPQGAFDVILLLDVLEHVADDGEFLAGVVHELMHSGSILATATPAYPALFTGHDRSLGHFRRYCASRLRRLLAGAGLHVELGGGLYTSLLPARGAQKLGELVRGIRSVPDPDAATASVETDLGRWRAGPLLTRAVLALLSADGALNVACARAGIALPGLSLWALARKP